MKRALTMLILLVISCLPAACGSGTPLDRYDGYKFIGTKSFTFNTQVKPETLTFHKTVSLFSYFPRENQYLISNAGELDAFNQPVERMCDNVGNALELEMCNQAVQRERVTLENFETFTYFLIGSFLCGKQEFTGYSYDGASLTLTFNSYISEGGCAAVYADVYDVYRANK